LIINRFKTNDTSIYYFYYKSKTKKRKIATGRKAKLTSPPQRGYSARLNDICIARQ